MKTMKKHWIGRKTSFLKRLYKYSRIEDANNPEMVTVVSDV